MPIMEMKILLVHQRMEMTMKFILSCLHFETNLIQLCPNYILNIKSLNLMTTVWVDSFDPISMSEKMVQLESNVLWMNIIWSVTMIKELKYQLLLTNNYRSTTVIKIQLKHCFIAGIGNWLVVASNDICFANIKVHSALFGMRGCYFVGYLHFMATISSRFMFDCISVSLIVFLFLLTM